jgi:hypothetical protein
MNQLKKTLFLIRSLQGMNHNDQYLIISLKRKSFKIMSLRSKKKKKTLLKLK